MNLDDSLNAALRVLRRRPTEVLPPFLADSALAVVVQLSVVAGAFGLLAVRGTARFRRLFSAVRELDPPVSQAEAAAAEAALWDLFTPTAIAILVLAAVLGVVLAVLVRSAAGAAKVHAAWAAMSDGQPCVAAVGGTLADTGTFVRLTLLQLVLFAGPLVVGVVGAVVVGGQAGLAVAGLAILLWLPIALGSYFLLLFVPEIIVVEGVGLVAAIRRNASFLGDHPGRSVVFGLMELGTLFVVGSVAGAFGAFGVGRITALVTLFLAVPFLGLLKMGLYVEPGSSGVPAGESAGGVDEGWTTETGNPDRQWDQDTDRQWEQEPDRQLDHDSDGTTRRRETPPEARRPGPDADPGRGVIGGSLVSDLRSIVGQSVAELRAFVFERPGLVGVSLATFLVGVVVGYWIGVATGIEIASEVPTRDVFGAFPLDTAINLSANNWQVAIAQAYAGVAFGVPVLGNLAFNGAVVGGLAGLGFDLATFAALVVPHGLIEVPALAVGGAVGLFMAGRGWAVYRGQITTEDAGHALRRAFLVLLGLAPAFLVAGVIEAFLTPAIAELLVG